MKDDEVWLVYVDQADDGDRESWSVFYCEPLVFGSEALAKDGAVNEVKRATMEDDWDDGDLVSHIVGPLTITKGEVK